MLFAQLDLRKLAGIESLRVELTGAGFRQLVLSPGLVDLGGLDERLVQDSAESLLRKTESPARRCKEANGAGQRSTLEVMIGGSQLDEALKKLAKLGVRGQPDGLPFLVRVPESLRIEAFDSRRE